MVENQKTSFGSSRFQPIKQARTGITFQTALTTFCGISEICNQSVIKKSAQTPRDAANLVRHTRRRLTAFCLPLSLPQIKTPPTLTRGWRGSLSKTAGRRLRLPFWATPVAGHQAGPARRARPECSSYSVKRPGRASDPTVIARPCGTWTPKPLCCRAACRSARHPQRDRAPV
jgi:hypothetical protein